MVEMEQRQQISDFLFDVVGIRDPQLFHIALNHSHITEIPKGTFLYKPGMPFPGPGFLMSGLLRIYGMSPIADATRTDRFCAVPGQTVFPGWNTTHIPHIHIQALENSRALLFPRDSTKKLLPENLEAIKIFNRGATADLALQIELQDVLAQYNAAQRYEWFLEKHPGLIDRVPHVYIASYLGITPVTLSRVRNRLNHAQGQKACTPPRKNMF